MFKFDILKPVDCLKYNFRRDLKYSRSKAVKSWVGFLYIYNLLGLQEVVLSSFHVVVFDTLKKNQEVIQSRVQRASFLIVTIPKILCKARLELVSKQKAQQWCFSD